MEGNTRSPLLLAPAAGVARLVTCNNGKRAATSRSSSLEACFRSPTV